MSPEDTQCRCPELAFCPSILQNLTHLLSLQKPTSGFSDSVHFFILDLCSFLLSPPFYFPWVYPAVSFVTDPDGSELVVF